MILAVTPNTASMGLFVLKLAVAVIFIKHGWPKVKHPQSMAANMNWGAWRVVVQGLVEVLGGLALIVGFEVQAVAIFLGIIMLGAIYYKIFRWHAPFSGGGGWEFDLSLLAASIAILLTGGGTIGLF